METKNGDSRRSLQNQAVRIKAWVRSTEYHPIQQIPGIGALVHSPAEPSETHHSDQIKKDRPQEGLHLRTRGTLGQTPLLGSTVAPNATARRSTSSAKGEATTDHRTTNESSAASPKTEA
jgi:hypothetical protein